jgi:hypothetical protein
MSTAFTDREHGLLIGGQWRPSASGDTLTSVNPATGRPLATCARPGGLAPQYRDGFFLEQYTETKSVWVNLT